MQHVECCARCAAGIAEVPERYLAAESSGAVESLSGYTCWNLLALLAQLMR